MKKTLATVKSRYFAPVVAGAGMLASTAFAQSANPAVTLLEGVSFDGIAAKVLAVGAIIVGFHMSLKGITIVKRVINKA